MSAPSGSRGSRPSIRARGSARGGSRGSRGRDAQQHSRRAAASSGTRSNSSQPYLNSPGHRNQIRSRIGNGTSPSGAQLSSAILSHAGTISKLKDQPWRNAAEQDGASYKQRMSDLYQTLKEKRERERKKAIKDGFLADPDKPTSLANAITPVGTCPDMCPEFERVERIVQLMVDANEKISSISDTETKVPCEELMVKRFRRSAAGYDEQLPSDIRPPNVLQKTLNHLFDTVIGGPEPLANTHKFVWDRTRGIRNDFSIQQVTKVEDLRIAIDCFERIARFHILSLHQLSHPNRDNGEFDHHQEREQLNNTLLSLMYYYDDSRHKLSSPNEAEFRAYCIIFEIQDQRPDLEDRAQNWPSAILKDVRVKTALKLYAAAGNTSDEQGPLRPRTSFSTAQANPGGFFELVQSNLVSYVMACVAEIYFNLVRSTALESIWKAYKGKRPGAAKVEDWLLEDVTSALSFDDQDQSRTFCEEHEFNILEREDGEEYLNLGSVTGSNLKDNNPRRKQMFSQSLVESKRHSRSLPAVINGLCFSDAQAQGLVNDSDADNASVAYSDSLFINGGSDEERKAQRSGSVSPLPEATTNRNGAPRLDGVANPFPFKSNGGAPSSSKPNPFEPTSSIQSQSDPVSGSSTTAQASNPFAPKEPPEFSFFPTSNQRKSTASLVPSPFGNGEAPKFNFFPMSNAEETKDPTTNVTRPTGGEPKAVAPTSPGTSSFKPIADASSTSQSIFRDSRPPPTTPMFSFGASSPFSQKPTNPEATQTPFSNLNQDQAKAEVKMQPKAAEPEPSGKETPSFSFETSSLFQSVAKETRDESRSLLSQSTTFTQSSLSSPTLSTPKPPNSTPFAPGSPPISSDFQTSTQSSSFFPKPTSSLSPKAPNSMILPAFDFQAPNATSPSKSTQSQEAPQATVISPTSQPSFSSSAPASRPQQAQNVKSFPAPPVSTKISTPSPNNQLPSKSVTSKAPPLDPRPETLEKVTNGLMFDDGGLLQQYIEISLVPIMKTAMAQFEDEESWKAAREYRLILLAKKYFQKWKVHAWNLGVMRRGRERRQDIARSMQSLAKSTQQRQEEVSKSSFLDVISSQNRRQKPQSQRTDTMLPPALPKNKRQSLPVDFKAEMSGALNTPRKRKLDNSDFTRESKAKQSHTSGHKRSSTVDFSRNAVSVMSAPPHRDLHSRQSKSIGISKLTDGSLLSNNIMKQARRMATSTRSDTTQTDYFRLKALGIEPDTPVIPMTKRRAVGNEETTRATRTPDERFRADFKDSDELKQSTSNLPAKTNISVSNDEEFFASIRAIRSTLADSTSWFQSERESIERSMTPSQASASPPSGKKETAAERRLREIKERGHNPSRSEIRLRAMGDKSLLPEGFWDGEGIGRNLLSVQKGERKYKDVENKIRGRSRQELQQVASGSANIGFAALANQPLPTRNGMIGFDEFSDQRQQTGLVNGFGQHAVDVEQPQQNGVSADDVIELSD